MEDLPDDVLILIMQSLDLEDILNCRLVCKRLWGLALHRDVWARRSLADDDRRAGAVLLLAPCLQRLTVTGRVPTLAVTSTWCAVASLKLRQAQFVAFNPAEYAFIVYKQESLGRLRRLELCHLTCRMNTVADVLVRTIASCSGLEAIDVLGSLPVTSRPVVPGGPSRSSLRKFRCLVDGHSASFTNAILVGHAATLEEVHILSQGDFEEPLTVALFAGLPRLCSLRCDDSIRWLEAMAACSTLRDVFICLFKRLDRLERVAKFLRQASQLQRVHLENCAKGLTAEYCTALVEALASAEQSKLERLALEGFEDVSPLLGVLPSLPVLRHLDVTSATPDDALLQSITPATAPALRRLELGVQGVQCPHAWVHGAAVGATLVENPALHILVRVWRFGRKRCGPDDCEACAGGCHREVKWGQVGKVGLYSHGPGECPSPEDHADDVDWQKTDRRTVTVTCAWVHV